MKQVNLLKIVKALQGGPLTAYEAHQQFQLSLSQCRRWMVVLRQWKIVHVCAWETNGNNIPMIPVYAWGDKPNARKPPKASGKERAARYRERLKGARLEPIVRALCSTSSSVSI